MHRNITLARMAAAESLLPAARHLALCHVLQAPSGRRRAKCSSRCRAMGASLTW